MTTKYRELRNLLSLVDSEKPWTSSGLLCTLLDQLNHHARTGMAFHVRKHKTPVKIAKQSPETEAAIKEFKRILDE